MQATLTYFVLPVEVAVPVNADKPHRWKSDIAQSVDLYNIWFMQFAPQAYRNSRVNTTKQVEGALKETANLTNIRPALLRQNPSIVAMLRMVTAPPIARDRLIGLAGVEPHLVQSMEVNQRVPPKMSSAAINMQLERIAQIIMKLADRDLFPWLEKGQTPNEAEVQRAATVVADRLCGAATDPIIRNAQEQRQLTLIRQWLEQRGYLYIASGSGLKFGGMLPGTFSFRLNVPGKQEDSKAVNIPIDTVIMPLQSAIGSFPLLIEAKSAGDFTNTNKRRKEEGIKIAQLRRQYGPTVRFVLFLCGYFDSGYLGYEAAEGIDWVWEHRIDDLTEFGV